MYSEDDMLMLSGIQHFRFCPRQWALTHIDQQWEDNLLTIEGEILHRHVDDPFYRQKCGDNICLRAVRLASYQLGLYGIADVVELHPTEDLENSITHPKYPGHWLPVPIEYKHGKSKKNEVDEVQLMVQAICLEEMYNIHLTKGAFFYAEIRHRKEVIFTDRLREIVIQCSNEMHQIFTNGTIPQPLYDKKCMRCSLNNLCLPQIQTCSSVKQYLTTNLCGNY